MEELIRKYPARKSEIAQLYHHYANAGECYVDAIYVQGGPSTGKTTIVSHVLRTLRIRHAFVNLIECYSTRILLESVLNQLAEHRVTPAQTASYAKCDNVMEFVRALKKLAHDSSDLQRAVIVLDKAEMLRDMDSNLMPCFLRLRELTAINISVLLLSEIALQKYYMQTNIVQPLRMHFPQYTKDDFLEILSLDFPLAKEHLVNNVATRLDVNVEFYRNYLNVFLSVFYRACRDLSELRYMARINFVKYVDPVVRNECTLSDSMALWRHIAPIIKSALEVLYLRLSDDESVGFAKERLTYALELPFYAKYLLIAAYLASYNPAKDDKRLFMKFHGKKTKTKLDVNAKSKVAEKSNTQMGPKAFSFDRLLAIFYAILDDKVAFNNNLLVQVSSLVRLQLLSALSDNCNLDGQKYKCTIGFEFVLAISKMVGFNIRKYLSDFSHI